MQAINPNRKLKILFITMAADGHFYPLTGVAKHLQDLGHDVRWYTEQIYQSRLEKLEIPHYPYIHAPRFNQENFAGFFAERESHKSQVAKFKFDLEHIFIRPIKLGIIDVEDIYNEFRFDIVIADIFSFIIPLIKVRFGVPVIAGGIIPLMESSRELPPAGLGMTPSSHLPGRMKQSALRWMTDKMIFPGINRLFKEIVTEYGVQTSKTNVFDILYHAADIVLQSGTPGFEYKRSDLGENIRFAGPMLPFSAQKEWKPWFDDRLNHYENIIIVTQGTVEKDINKILVPALTAFKHTDVLVICTTGGSKTRELRERFNSKNIIIEDFIPFADIMPYADVYVTNGGYGGIMLAIQNELPVVAAGVHEGKNEICARIGYFKYGINLKTETPKPAQIRKAVKRLLSDSSYRENVRVLRDEFADYDPNKICEQYVNELGGRPPIGVPSANRV